MFEDCEARIQNMIWENCHVTLYYQGRRKVWKSGRAHSTGWGECAPLVDIGLTDLPKIGGHMPPRPPSPLATGLTKSA